MFSLRNQIGALLTAVAALVIAAIPVTITFAQTYQYSYPNQGMYGYQQPQQYTYWCMGQNGGYSSSMPCPVYPQNPQPTYPQQPTYPHNSYHQQYYYPQYSYYYPQYYYPVNYGYNYGSYNYSYAYNYNYNYSNYWSYWY